MGSSRTSVRQAALVDEVTPDEEPWRLSRWISWVEPYYAYLDQDNQFGPAHIAQLNGYWPF